MPEPSAHAAATQLLGGVAGSQTSHQERPAEGARLRSADRSAGHSTGRRTYLSLKQIGEKFDISERTAHKLIAEAWFPAPVRLGPKVNRWIEDEVDTAVAARAPRRLEREPEPQRLALSRAARSQAAGAA